MLWEKINVCLHFLSSPCTEYAQVFYRSHGMNRSVYPTQSISWPLMTWRCTDLNRSAAVIQGGAVTTCSIFFKIPTKDTVKARNGVFVVRVNFEMMIQSQLRSMRYHIIPQPHYNRAALWFSHCCAVCDIISHLNRTITALHYIHIYWTCFPGQFGP